LNVSETKDGTLWLGTDGSGMFELKKSGNSFTSREFAFDFNQPDGIGGNVVKTILEDSKNNLWIGMYGTGLDFYDRNSNTFQHFTNDPADPYSISSYSVWTMVENKDGLIWIGTIGNGINIYDPATQQFANSINDKSLADLGTQIMTLLISEEMVYIGEQNDGLIVYNTETKQIQKYKNDPQDATTISNDEIRSIFKSKNGDIWIGTEGGGLNKWLGQGKFLRIQKQDGLIANTVMGITEDEQQNLWISTFNGISQFDPKSKEITNFAFNSEKNNQFNQMAIHTSQDGQVYFGGINGLNFLHPSRLVKEQIENEIVFTTLLVNNEEIVTNKDILHRPIEISEKISLNHDAKSFTLKFTNFNYSQSEEQLFQYRLNGFDEKWNTLKRNTNSINYTNISSGNYELEIKNELTSKKLKIEIRTPF